MTQEPGIIFLKSAFFKIIFLSIFFVIVNSLFPIRIVIKHEWDYARLHIDHSGSMTKRDY